jgi:hypothetical protein
MHICVVLLCHVAVQNRVRNSTISTENAGLLARSRIFMGEFAALVVPLRVVPSGRPRRIPLLRISA